MLVSMDEMFRSVYFFFFPFGSRGNGDRIRVIYRKITVETRGKGDCFGQRQGQVNCKINMYLYFKSRKWCSECHRSLCQLIHRMSSWRHCSSSACHSSSSSRHALLMLLSNAVSTARDTSPNVLAIFLQNIHTF
jgi:hypothetical protein